ncbi:hypothetical protein [Polyangium sp. 6x1]|uniref:hypothetical protein n=1 Tax=Polyangium sp. 6x1 TaxID=3042689 RepID=UPI0024828BA9|nr:hypothetical protein [Polyangium sp. 6x1]MDI1443057.1 hypothetical protein [Polyangium sp. 6x1]
MPPTYPHDRKLKKARKTSHGGLDPARFKPVLEWLEGRWSQDEPTLVHELDPERRSFESWLLALAQGFGDAVVTRDGATAPPDATTVTAIRRQTGLSSLADLMASRVCELESIHLQLIVAWLWARGHTATSKRRLHEVQQITGYTDTQIKNILQEAEPARISLGRITRRRDLWRLRDSCRLALVHTSSDEASARAIDQALRANDEALPLVTSCVDRANALADAMNMASAGDFFLLLWSRSAAIELSSGTWVREVAEAVARSRVFVVLGELDGEPAPEGLSPRAIVPFHASMREGVDAILRIWRSDRSAELASDRRVAPSRHALHDEPDGTTIYVASTHGEIVVPMSVHLDAPAGVYVTRLVETLRLPSSFEILGRTTHVLRYAFFHEGRTLNAKRSFAAQGVGPGSLLELGFHYEEIRPERSKIDGYFRSIEDDEARQQRKRLATDIHAAVDAALDAAGLGTPR